MRLRPRSIRTRLTLWYLAVLAVILSLYVTSTLGFLYVSLREELERALRADQASVSEHLVLTRAGAPRFRRHLEEIDDPALIEIWSSDGSLLYRSAALAGSTLGEPPTTDLDRAAATWLVRANGQLLRVLTRSYQVSGHALVVSVARNESHLWRQWRRMLVGLLLGLPVALVVAGLGGHWLARRTLRPIEAMAHRAEVISVDNLAERLPVEDPGDELGHLARVFNAALARIEGSVAELRRFTADASHELRTPLTSLRAVGEVVLQEPRDPRRYREAIGSMLEEVDGLSHLVDSLLVLSRSETGSDQPRTAAPLLGLVHDAVALLEVLAEEKNQTINVSGDTALVVSADAMMLKRALVNLVDNAIKYSPSGGAIEINAHRDDAAHAIVEIRDQGCGIPREHQAKVFDRFYRADAGRSRDAGGVGLGLAIADRAVRMHGGRIELESEDGRGSVFRIVLPVQPA